MTKRVIIMLLDSVGIGHSHDSALYGDKTKGGDHGANTLGNILLQHPNTLITNLTNLGLLNSFNLSVQHNNTQNKYVVNPCANPTASYGFAIETSVGKDTITGHWELMGCPVDFEWGYFTNPTNSFPQNLLNTLYTKGNIAGSLGNCVASGTDIINKFGEEHIKTLKPIFYTSADSVFQIAASEEHFGLQNLYNLCEIAREELYKDNIGRVIARPFTGNNPTNFKRTGNRKDYSIAPSNATVLNTLVENNGQVIAIGKVADIFANSGISKSIKASGLTDLFNATIAEIKKEPVVNTIVFTNFVDFDSEFGHRRDVVGYKNALEYFDSRLPEALSLLTENDLLVIIADHGNDPTWYGTDHTREHVPVLFYNKATSPKNLGQLNSFSDVAQSIATYLNLPKLKHGKSFI